MNETKPTPEEMEKQEQEQREKAKQLQNTIKDAANELAGAIDCKVIILGFHNDFGGLMIKSENTSSLELEGMIALANRK